MTPGLIIKRGCRLHIRQLRPDDLPRMIAGAFGGEDGAHRWYAQELGKGDGAGAEFRRLLDVAMCGEGDGVTPPECSREIAAGLRSFARH